MRLPLSWPALRDAMRVESAAAVRERILALARGTEHEARALAFIADAGADVGQLRSIEVALKEKVHT